MAYRPPVPFDKVLLSKTRPQHNPIGAVYSLEDALVELVAATIEYARYAISVQEGESTFVATEIGLTNQAARRVQTFAAMISGSSGKEVF